MKTWILISTYASPIDPDVEDQLPGRNRAIRSFSDEREF